MANIGCVQCFFLLGKFHQKENFKIQKRSDFGGFQSPKVRKNSDKNCQIHTLGFHCVAKKRRRRRMMKDL
jgi:hypothetical protein